MLMTGAMVAVLLGIAFIGYSLYLLSIEVALFGVGIILTQIGLFAVYHEYLQDTIRSSLAVSLPKGEPEELEAFPEELIAEPAVQEEESESEVEAEEPTASVEEPVLEQEGEGESEEVAVASVTTEPEVSDEGEESEEVSASVSEISEQEEPPRRKKVPLRGYIYYHNSGEYVPMFQEPVRIDDTPAEPVVTPVLASVVRSQSLPSGQQEDANPRLSSKYWSFPIDPSVDLSQIDLSQVPGPNERHRGRPEFALGDPRDDLVGVSPIQIESN
ncbi:MAG: hypothetical protein GX030_08765 [Firmicutes bacterium]|nr:hypothetical protein [Bacillota bacterium]